MPHFTVRKQIPGAGYFPGMAQTGKRFFYDINALGHPINHNTVTNYEMTLQLSESNFLKLIQDMAGNSAAIIGTQQYRYHLPKQNNSMNKSYLKTLGVPDMLGNYTLTGVAIAANYNKHDADGNILIIFSKAAANLAYQDELVINIHIKHSYNNRPDYANNLRVHVKAAIDNKNLGKSSPIHSVKAHDDFLSMGYLVTNAGAQEEKAYKAAYRQSQVAYLFTQLPQL